MLEAKCPNDQLHKTRHSKLLDLFQLKIIAYMDTPINQENIFLMKHMQLDDNFHKKKHYYNHG